MSNTKRCVVRGGAFDDLAGNARVAYRYLDLAPVNRHYGIGFRVVVSPKKKVK
jgi:hypothetical protein